MFRALSLVALSVCLSAPLVACGGADSPATDGESGDAVRSALTRRNLPRGDLRTKSEEIAQEWLDNNIMTGDVRLDAGVLDGRLTKVALQKFSEKIVTDHLKSQERTFRDVKSETPEFADGLLEDATIAIGADGFVYDRSNPDNFVDIEKQVRDLVALLGDSSKLDAVLVKTRASDGEAEEKRVTQFLFVNRETKQYLAFYAREGTT